MKTLSLLALFLMVPCCSQSAQIPEISKDRPPPAIGVNPPPPPDAPSGDAGAKVAALTAGFNLHYGSEYCDQDDSILRGIASDIEKKLGAFEGRRTPLKLFRYYSDVSEKTLGFGNVDKKLDKLFLCGRIPRQLKGFHHGVTLSLRTDLSDRLHVDFLRGFYGRLVAPGNPWAGKSFEEIGPEQLKSFTGTSDLGGATNYLGVNSFRHDTQTKGGRAQLNAMARAVLKHVIDTKAVPRADEYKDSWIESTGGYFLAREASSLDPDHPNKRVLALNYRWKNLGNKFPNDRLIDEIVEVADGLYLGKLFYATNVDSKPFDPRKPIEVYRYRSFGYFLLMDDWWVHDKNALWPELMTEVATKSFFFVTMPNASVNPQNHKKWVFQFHYRWKDLHTMPPDNLCTDEIVRIADGLYLGQLLYATNLNIPFDPDRNFRHPEDYRYRLFGYFLLMDDDWKSLMDHTWSDNL